ncbi:hypothetical protein [Mesorhizobium sp. M0909]|uniref:hypothetical protein n=1 Tax=Mesorhizobium sp. M0909 TaxID=2957024 RepID=UPI003337774D
MTTLPRSTDYSEEVAAHICEEITSGRSLRSICKDKETDWGEWYRLMGERLGAKTINIGVAGTRLAYTGQNTTPEHARALQYLATKFATAIKTGDWSGLIAAAEADHVADPTLNGDFRRAINSATAIDWASVEVCLFSFGTNDWSAGVPLGIDADTTESSSLRGAMNFIVSEISATISEDAYRLRRAALAKRSSRR